MCLALGSGGPLTAPPVNSLPFLHPVAHCPLGWLSCVASERPSSQPAPPLWGLSCLSRASPRRGGDMLLQEHFRDPVRCRLQPPGGPGKVDCHRKTSARCTDQKSTFQGPPGTPANHKPLSLSSLSLAPHFLSPWQAPRPEAPPVRGWGGQRPQTGDTGAAGRFQSHVSEGRWMQGGCQGPGVQN